MDVYECCNCVQRWSQKPEPFYSAYNMAGEEVGPGRGYFIGYARAGS